MKNKIMRDCKIIIIVLIFLQSANSKLTRSNEVYKNVIKGVCNYYYCQSVILFYLHQNSTHTQDIETSTRLRNLFIYLNINQIKAVISNVDSFIRLGIHRLRKTENSILVFLGDADCMKAHLKKELAPLTALPQLAWLIFFDDNVTIDDFFAGFYIPFDCRFMVSMNNNDAKEEEIITEIYRVKKGTELRQNNFGNYDDLKTSIKLPKSNFHKRRNNLHGHTLGVSTLNNPPISIVTVDKNNTIKLRGTMGLIMDILKQSMNFTTTYHIVNEYGRFSNGNWTGAVRTLIDGLSDIMAIVVVMTDTTMDVMDFSQAFNYNQFYFFSKKPVILFSWDTFVQPFHRDTWITLACIVLLAGIAIRFISRFYEKRFPLRRFNRKLFNKSDDFLEVFGAFCNQGMPKSRITPIMIIQCSIHLTATVVLAAYSGILISSLTTDTTLTHARTVKDLLNDESARIGVLNVSGFYDSFKHTKDETIRQLYEKKLLHEDTLPATTKEGVERACSEDNYSFLINYFQASRLKLKGCELRATERILKLALAFGMQERSPFREIINQHLLLMRDSGILGKLTGQWAKIEPFKNQSRNESVDIFHMISLIIFLLGNYIISLFFLWCEKLIFRQSTKRQINEMQKIVKQIHIVNIKDHKKTR